MARGWEVRIELKKVGSLGSHGRVAPPVVVCSWGVHRPRGEDTHCLEIITINIIVIIIIIIVIITMLIIVIITIILLIVIILIIIIVLITILIIRHLIVLSEKELNWL